MNNVRLKASKNVSYADIYGRVMWQNTAVILFSRWLEIWSAILLTPANRASTLARGATKLEIQLSIFFQIHIYLFLQELKFLAQEGNQVGSPKKKCQYIVIALW